jgi:hypothetical protein
MSDVPRFVSLDEELFRTADYTNSLGDPMPPQTEFRAEYEAMEMPNWNYEPTQSDFPAIYTDGYDYGNWEQSSVQTLNCSPPGSSSSLTSTNVIVPSLNVFPFPLTLFVLVYDFTIAFR